MIRSINLNRKDLLGYYKKLFNLSLPHEISFKLLCIEFNLISFGIKNKDLLLNKIKETDFYKYYLAIK